MRQSHKSRTALNLQLGNQLRELREKQNLSQEALLDKLSHNYGTYAIQGISTIQRIEAGKTSVKAIDLMMLLHVLHGDLHDFLSLLDEPAPLAPHPAFVLQKTMSIVLACVLLLGASAAVAWANRYTFVEQVQSRQEQAVALAVSWLQEHYEGDYLDTTRLDFAPLLTPFDNIGSPDHWSVAVTDDTGSINFQLRTDLATGEVGLHVVPALTTTHTFILNGLETHVVFTASQGARFPFGFDLSDQERTRSFETGYFDSLAHLSQFIMNAMHEQFPFSASDNPILFIHGAPADQQGTVAYFIASITRDRYAPPRRDFFQMTDLPDYFIRVKPDGSEFQLHALIFD